MLPLLFWGLYDPVFIVTDVLLANHYVVFCQFMLKLYHLFSTLSNYITSANNYHSLQLPTLALELWINWIHSFINCLALLIYLIAYWLLFDVLPVPEFHLSFLANLNSSCICLEASINLLWTQEAPVNSLVNPTIVCHLSPPTWINQSVNMVKSDHIKLSEVKWLLLPFSTINFI